MAQTIFESPATRVTVITPADSDLAAVPRSLWVGGAGNLRITAEGDSADVVLTAVPAGTLLPIRVKRVWSTNTTATLILGLA